MHKQFLKHGEHPYRMQVDDEIGHRRIDFRVFPLHGCEPCLDQFRGAVGVAFTKMFQQRALCAKQQNLQQGTMLVNKRNIFVYAGFQILFRLHPHHIFTPYAVMLLQHCLQCMHHRTNHLAKQFIFARKVVVDVSHANTCQLGYFAHGSFGITFLPELQFGNRQNTPPYVFFQHLH